MTLSPSALFRRLALGVALSVVAASAHAQDTGITVYNAQHESLTQAWADGFYDDDRDTTEKAFWNKNPCMKDCRAPVKITGHASVIDVTPDDKTARKSGVE